MMFKRRNICVCLFCNGDLSKVNKYEPALVAGGAPKLRIDVDIVVAAKIDYWKSLN